MTTIEEIEADERALAEIDADTPETIFDLILRWPDEPSEREAQLVAQVQGPGQSAFVEVHPVGERDWEVWESAVVKSGAVPSYAMACVIAQAVAVTVLAELVATAPDPRVTEGEQRR